MDTVSTRSETSDGRGRAYPRGIHAGHPFSRRRSPRDSAGKPRANEVHISGSAAREGAPCSILKWAGPCGHYECTNDIAALDDAYGTVVDTPSSDTAHVALLRRVPQRGRRGRRTFGQCPDRRRRQDHAPVRNVLSKTKMVRREWIGRMVPEGPGYRKRLRRRGAESASWWMMRRLCIESH